MKPIDYEDPTIRAAARLAYARLISARTLACLALDELFDAKADAKITEAVAMIDQIIDEAVRYLGAGAR